MKSRSLRAHGMVKIEICTVGKVIIHFALAGLGDLCKQTDYAFRRGKDMLQQRLFYVFSHK
jgi:hypothetical protein